MKPLRVILTFPSTDSEYKAFLEEILKLRLY